MINENLNSNQGAERSETAPVSVNPYPPTSDTSNSKITWMLSFIALALIIVGGVFVYMRIQSQAVLLDTKLVRIGLSLDSVKIQRWADERDIMVEKAKSMNATVTTLSAEGDDSVQISQIQNFIAQKVDSIIVVAHNADALGEVITEAQKAGIKVINYDRLTSNSKPDLYISFDSVKVGQYAAQYVVDAIPSDKKVPNIAYVGGSTTDKNSYYVLEGAMSVIDPLVKAGKAKLVFNEFTKDWSPSEAYTNFKRFLDNGGKVDGVVSANDAMAYGVIQALGEYGLAGKVPVSGQDGELQAIQRILNGTQTITAYKPGRLIAERAVVAAVDFANGEKPEVNSVVNNKTADIPSYLLDPIPVTKNNIKDTVIKDGTFTESQVYNSSGAL